MQEGQNLRTSLENNPRKYVFQFFFFNLSNWEKIPDGPHCQIFIRLTITVTFSLDKHSPLALIINPASCTGTHDKNSALKRASCYSIYILHSCRRRLLDLNAFKRSRTKKKSAKCGQGAYGTCRKWLPRSLSRTKLSQRMGSTIPCRIFQAWLRGTIFGEIPRGGLFRYYLPGSYKFNSVTVSELFPRVRRDR